MARKYITEVREEKALRFKITVREGLKVYKDAWLILNNHVREYPDMFYKVSNVSDTNDIYVLSNPEHRKNVESFISQFGDVSCEDYMIAFVDVCCDYDDFDKDHIDYEVVLGEIE